VPDRRVNGRYLVALKPAEIDALKRAAALTLRDIGGPPALDGALEALKGVQRGE
jgi:hypothetical protein